jgi:hypothetical protein
MGPMGSFWKAVNEVIEKSDIVLEILDARFVDETRNAEIEKKVLCRGKKIIYVINKCDLVPKEQSEKKKKELKPSVFISAKDHLGTTMLRKLILETAKKESVVVGVVGYPNTGKSSVINALAGREKAKTSSVSGYTRGIQAVRADKRLSLLDTPGVIPFMEEDEFLHAVIGAKDSSKVREPDYIVMRLMENAHGTVEKHYGVQEAEDPEQGLEKIAIRLNMLMKGGVPDVEKASRKILSDWQKGDINLSR